MSSFELAVLENGRPVQGTTTLGESSATFVPTSDISAGTLAVSASIADSNGVSVSAEQTYEVFPTYEALTPATALPDEALTVTARGLDPAGSNSLLFYSLRAPGTVEAILESIDRDAGTATVRVPDMAATGMSFVKVNGRISQTGLRFTRRFPYTICGPSSHVVAMADGSLILFHGRVSPALPGCPSLSEEWGTVVSRSHLDGRVTVLDTFKRSDAGGLPGTLRELAVDTTGEEYALLTQGIFGAGYYIKHGERVVELADPWDWRGYHGLDFDAAGNFVLTKKEGGGVFGGTVRFLLVTAEAFETQEFVTPQEIASLTLDDSAYFVDRFEISCANQLYFGVYQWSETGDSISSSIYRLDLSTGQISKRVDMPDIFTLLALSCHTGEIIGVSRSWDNTVNYWRWVDGSGQPVQIDQVQGVFDEDALLVLPSGTILTFGADELAERLEPCTDCDDGSCCAGSAQPFCPRPPAAGITILDSTTRWRPQRKPDFDPVTGATKPIEIKFTSTAPLEAAVVTLSGPASVEPISVTFDPANPPNPYVVTWSGLDASGKPMPAGNYTISIAAQPAGGGDVAHSGLPERVVSLVEVTGVRFDPALEANPEILPRPGSSQWARPGGGVRILPEAAEHTSTEVMDRVRVVASLTPPVDDAPADSPIRVWFKSIDVDDPATAFPLIDDDSRPTDNCVRSPITPDCPTSPHGRFVNPVPSHETPDETVDGRTGVVIAASGNEAAATFIASRQHGDNYRVVASTDQEWLNQIVAIQGVSKGEVRHASSEAVLDEQGDSGPQVSPMLTVWRTLHLEVDHLDSTGVQQYGPDPTGSKVVLDVTGSIATLTPQRLTDSSAPFVVPTQRPTPTEDHSRPNDWAGADLWLKHPPSSPAAPSVKVTANGTDHVEVGMATDLTMLGAVGDAYRLSDDRLVTLDGGLPLTLTERILGEVYIRIDACRGPQSANARPLQQFRRNLEFDAQRALTRDLPNSKIFWAVLLVDAFDPRTPNDHDPDVAVPPRDQRPVFGTTGARTRAGLEPVCAVFREVVRELWRKSTLVQTSPEILLELVTGHEILCHALGNVGSHATDAEIGLVYTTLCRPYEPGISEGFSDLSEQQRAKLRRLTVPQIGRIQ